MNSDNDNTDLTAGDTEALEAANAPLPDEIDYTAEQGAADKAKDDDTPDPDKDAASDGEDGEQAAASDDAENAGDGEDDDATVDKKPKPKRKGGVQKRFDDLTKRAREAETDAAYWRGVAEGRASAQQQGEDKDTPGEDDDPEPKQGDFETDAEFLAATAQRAARQAVKAERASANDERQQADAEADALARAQEFAKRVDGVRDQFDDFDTVALADDLPVSQAMAAVIQASEHGPAVLYHLGSNPEESARIAALDPLSAAREIGLIEAKLSLPKPKRNSAAPDPVNIVGDGGEAPPPNLENLSMEEYTAARQSGKIR